MSTFAKSADTKAKPQSYSHIPVLLNEVLEFLDVKRGGRYLDGTLGLGGHAEAILNACEGELLCLDRDPEALALASLRLAPFVGRAHLRQTCFSGFAAILKAIGWNHIDGAILDLGVSSLQIDSPKRGFSFLHDGPLDMRMGAFENEEGEPKSAAQSAFELVNTLSFEALRKLITEYGEEPMAGPIAKAIVQNRSLGIHTTGELASIIEAAYPAKWRATARRHPATRTFQALRMAVNEELAELKFFLEHIGPWLAPRARLLVISFHSLEDRMVKHAFKKGAEECICPKHLALCVCKNRATYKLVCKKPILPSKEECVQNPRAGSAKLRVVEKI